MTLEGVREHQAALQAIAKEKHADQKSADEHAKAVGDLQKDIDPELAQICDKALAVVLRGILAKSGTKIAQGRDAISQTLPYVTSGDGFYVDGSFIQHEDIAYIGSYGPVLLSDIARLFYILNGSTWSVTDPNAGNAYAWAMEAFRPFIYDGAMWYSVRGRAIARQFGDDHRNGRAVIGSMAELAQSLPASRILLAVNYRPADELDVGNRTKVRVNRPDGLTRVSA